MDRRSLLLVGLLLSLGLALAMSFGDGESVRGGPVGEPSGATPAGSTTVTAVEQLPGAESDEPVELLGVEHATAGRTAVEAEQPHDLALSSAFDLSVVLQETGEPLERFGAVIAPRRSGLRALRRDTRGLAIGHHPGGRLRMIHDELLPALWIDAEGAAPKGLAVEVEPGGELLVELQREGSVAGRLVRAGEVQVGVDLDLSGELGGFLGRDREATTDAEGRFRIGRLATGYYKLSVRGSGLASVDWSGLRVEAGTALELGDLEVQGGAGLGGRVLAAPGSDISLARVRLCRDEQGSRAFLPNEATKRSRSGKSPDGGKPLSQIVGLDSEYHFGGLSPGVYWVVVSDREDLVLDMLPQRVELPAGSQVERDLDTRTWLPRPVVVEVRGPLGPLEDVRVQAISVEPGPWPPELLTRDNFRGQARSGISSTDAEGRTTLIMTVGSPRGLTVSSKSGGELGRFPSAIDPLVEPRVYLAVEAASFSVESRDAWVAPRPGYVTYELTRIDEAPGGQGSRSSALGILPDTTIEQAFGGSSFRHASQLPPGHYRLVATVLLEVEESDRDAASAVREFKLETRPVKVFVGEVDLRDGDQGILVLE